MSGSKAKTMPRSKSGSMDASKTESPVRKTVQHTAGSMSEADMGGKAREGQQHSAAWDKLGALLGKSASLHDRHGVEKQDSPPEPATKAEKSVERKKERSMATRSRGMLQQDPITGRRLAWASQDQLDRKFSTLGLNPGVDGRQELEGKRCYGRQWLPEPPKGVNPLPYELLAVIDFKAVCKVKKSTPIIEIVEFPAVLVDVKRKDIVDIFREFCKPVFTSVPADYYNSLTAANQSEVDNGSTFPEVLDRFEQWLDHMTSRNLRSFCVVTDGNWDITSFMTKQCETSQMALPWWSRRWINISKSYAKLYSTIQPSLSDMLEKLGMPFEGLRHSGLDGAKSMARLACRMMKDGCTFEVNETLDQGHGQPTGKCSQPRGCPELLAGVPRRVYNSTRNPRDKKSAQGASASRATTTVAGGQSPGFPQAAKDEMSSCEEGSE